VKSTKNIWRKAMNEPEEYGKCTRKGCCVIAPLACIEILGMCKKCYEEKQRKMTENAMKPYVSVLEFLGGK